ncbi:50S ribosomal protein L18 [Candidatus Woesearchaeota archaeon]|nr:50S ribosomal protein L18 [Candidatus Woesearchaeota archaeon]
MSSKQVVAYRRKREGRTNYKKRLIYLKSKKPRLVIRKTNKQLLLQIVEYDHDGDKVVCGVASKELAKHGWKYSFNNTPACYLAGILLAKKAVAKNVKEAIVDFGFQTNTPKSRLYAALKGVVEGGLSIPVDESTFPSESRINGEHISSFFGKSEDKVQFLQYKEQKLHAEKMTDDVAVTKKKILA